MSDVGTEGSKARVRGWSCALAAAASLLAAAPVSATVVQCGGAATCAASFSIFVDQSQDEVGGGQIIYDAVTGAMTLDTMNNVRGGGMMDDRGGLMWDLGDGAMVSVANMWGNADPILGFGLGASTGATGRTFAFAFDLPIALTGQIVANSKVGYTLTSTTAAGAQITALGGAVVKAFEVDTTVGGLGSLPKGVDVGGTFFFLGGPDTQASPIYSAANVLTGDLAYDLMAVQIGFGLSANSSVGLSGFVQQLNVPLPAALPLLLSGIAAFGALSRRRRAAA